MPVEIFVCHRYLLYPERMSLGCMRENLRVRSKRIFIRNQISVLAVTTWGRYIGEFEWARWVVVCMDETIKYAE